MKILYSFMMSVLACSLSMLVSHGGRVGAQPSMQSQSKQAEKEPPLRVLVGTSKVSVNTARRTHDETTPNYSLKLTTSLLSQKLCLGDGEVSTLQTRLRLHYSNAGQRPIILYKRSNEGASIIVSRTAVDADASRHELNLSPTILRSREPRLTETQRLDHSFIIMPQGSSFDTETEVAIPFAANDQSTPAGTIKAGEHVLQIRVITWPGSIDLAETLGKRWKQRGYLWHEVVQSEPMPFRIEQQAKLEDCR